MVKTLAVVTCPNCGHKRREQMPTMGGIRSWTCPNCHATTHANDGECCIFCVYGNRRCPPRQLSWRADADKPG